MVRNSRADWKTYGNVFDNFTNENLNKLSGRGYFDELESTIQPGKEANIFTASKTDGSRVIVKIYRLQNCNFNKMFEYISQDPRYAYLKGNKRKTIFAWTQREYRNLLKAREVIRVPAVHVFKDNIIIMECIDEGKDIAPPLKDVQLKSPQSFFDEIIRNMKRLFGVGLVHGDLSEFNILVENNRPVFIDFSQCSSIKAMNAPDLLKRDIFNICKYFRKMDVEMDSEEDIFAHIIK